MVLPSHLVQDIDTEEDWITAEWMFKAYQMRVRTCS
jgi:CMP-N-acetylneuraminic acid synthetase